ADVKFLSRGEGYSLVLLSDKALLRVKSANARPINIGLELIGAHSKVGVSGVNQLPGVSNYFLGSDSSKWRTNVPTYSRVQYTNVYDGIDLVYYGNQRQLEYDFVVKPGADPRTIVLAIDRSASSEKLRIDSAGDLILAGPSGEIRFHKPVVYQADEAGSRHFIGGSYIVGRHNRIQFQIADYDKTKSLTIDPVLTYSTYLGNGSEIGMDVAVDSAGNA